MDEDEMETININKEIEKLNKKKSLKNKFKK